MIGGQLTGSNCAAVNSVAKVAPSEQSLNDLAEEIISLLSKIQSISSVINDRMYGCNTPESAQCPPPPTNLRERLFFTRDLVCGIGSTLDSVQNRL